MKKTIRKEKLFLDIGLGAPVGSLAWLRWPFDEHQHKAQSTAQNFQDVFISNINIEHRNSIKHSRKPNGTQHIHYNCIVQHSTAQHPS